MMTTVTAQPGGHDVASAVEAVFRSEYRSLVRLARLLVDDVGHAEEVVQDAFVALHRNWDRARDPVAYLRTCVVNGARGRLRRRQTARRHLRSVPADAAVEDADGVVLAESQRAVAAALAALPDRQRACVALRYYSGLTEAETAATLGISVGSVKTHVHRAMASLATRLEDLR
jgi:RNA polymerase sigma-70 factor (sigma-E family)